MSEIDLSKLREPFEPPEIEWRIGATNTDRMKGIALPYITNRAVQNRLDEVCGPENWSNEYKQIDVNGWLCGITIIINGRPIVKWDGADNTKVEPTKGGLSNAMKRAAAQWGIGRYLYDLPTYWVDIQSAGKSYKIVQPPQLPKYALPKGFKGEQKFAEGDRLDTEAQTLEDYLNNDQDDANGQITDQQAKDLLQILESYEQKGMISIPSVYKYFGVRDVYALTRRQRTECLYTLNAKDALAEKKKAGAKK